MWSPYSDRHLFTRLEGRLGYGSGRFYCHHRRNGKLRNWNNGKKAAWNLTMKSEAIVRKGWMSADSSICLAKLSISRWLLRLKFWLETGKLTFGTFHRFCKLLARGGRSKLSQKWNDFPHLPFASYSMYKNSKQRISPKVSLPPHQY